MAARERADIEGLVQLAYGRYRVERVTPAAAMGLVQPSWTLPCAGSAFMELGTRIDTSGRAAVLMAGFAEAASMPDDMVELHDRVLALPDVFLAETGAGLNFWTQAAAKVAGAVIERGDEGGWLLRWRGVDVRVDQVVTSMLVIQHGRLGTRPDWCEEGVQVKPFETDDRGRARVWDVEDAGGKVRRAACCPIRFDPHPLTMRKLRAEYTVWHDALVMLTKGFAVSPLATFDVTGPAASATPWRESKSVIHEDRSVAHRPAKRRA